jgi:hypothetical protein
LAVKGNWKLKIFNSQFSIGQPPLPVHFAIEAGVSHFLKKLGMSRSRGVYRTRTGGLLIQDSFQCPQDMSCTGHFSEGFNNHQ